MTFKYWFKIVLGMLVIFVIGAFGVRAFHHGEAFLNSDQPIAFSIPLLSAPFRLGGERLGKVERIRIERSAPRSVSGVALTVALDDSIPMSRFDGCSLALTEASRLDKNTTFVCSVPADSTRLQLVPFGTVTFRPGDHQVVLLVPQSMVADLQHNLSAGGAANDSGDVEMGSDSSSGSVHVRVNGKDIVSITGDSSGGAIRVFDRNGNKLVDIAGDSSGAHVLVNDSNGHNKVDVKATSAPRKSGGS